MIEDLRLHTAYSPKLEAYHLSFIKNLKGNFLHSLFFRKKIQNFKKAFDHIKKIPVQDSRLTPDSEIYKQIIYIDIANDIYYRLKFDIPFIEGIIKKYGFKVRQLLLNEERLHYDPNHINSLLLHVYLNQFPTVDKPIITIYHPYIGYELVIDGNKRFEQARIRKMESIPAFRLPSTAFNHILNDQVSSALFALHHNFTMLRNPFRLGKHYFYFQ
ncbi:MAG: hypothetical protein ACKO1F_16040 [Flammeovirgaceae bacterium]